MSPVYTPISISDVNYATGLLEEMDSIIQGIKAASKKLRVEKEMSTYISRLEEVFTLLDDTQKDLLSSSGAVLSRRFKSSVEERGLSGVVINLWKQKYSLKAISASTGLSAKAIKSFINYYTISDARTKVRIDKTSIVDTYAVMQSLYERILSRLDQLEGVSSRDDDVASKYTETLRKLIVDASTLEEKRANNMRVENVMRLIVSILQKKDSQFASEVIAEFRRHYAINESIFASPLLMDVSAN